LESLENLVEALNPRHLLDFLLLEASKVGSEVLAATQIVRTSRGDRVFELLVVNSGVIVNVTSIDHETGIVQDKVVLCEDLLQIGGGNLTALLHVKESESFMN
jgi:hypothetical protein